MFQSQTGSPSSSDRDEHVHEPELISIVSIPNGKPILFRRGYISRISSHFSVSIPNGKPILFRPTRLQLMSVAQLKVSIPNGKPILFRLLRTFWPQGLRCRFNPKREAHPLQTHSSPRRSAGVSWFQSQTGSPSSSDPAPMRQGRSTFSVSIPNGKPILFRRCAGATTHIENAPVSIPNGKLILFRRWIYSHT